MNKESKNMMIETNTIPMNHQAMNASFQFYNIEQCETICTNHEMTFDRYHVPESSSSLSMDEGVDDEESITPKSSFISISEESTSKLSPPISETPKSIITSPISETPKSIITSSPKSETPKSTITSMGEERTYEETWASMSPSRSPSKSKPPKPPRLSSIPMPHSFSPRRRKQKSTTDDRPKTAPSTQKLLDGKAKSEVKLLPNLLSQRPLGLMKRSTTGTAPRKKNNLISKNVPNKLNSKNHAQLWLNHRKKVVNKSPKKESKPKAEPNVHINIKKEKRWEEVECQDVIDDLGNAPKAKKKLVVNTDFNHDDDESVYRPGRTSSCSPSPFRKDWQRNREDGEGDFVQYDCWQILKDDLAQDYGFAAADSTTATCLNTIEISTTKSESFDSRNPPNTTIIDGDVNIDEDTSLREFKILGTSVDDLSSQPHVLSPPLMDSLLNFVPETISYENFWLKYSLVRDGSSFETLLHYIRASPNTIIAIQTTQGDVFGCFTTSPWENHDHEYFGNGESFVWKMRHNRRDSHCHSLYDQAHLESEIDVYPYSGFNNTVQFCSNKMLALGGIEIEQLSPLGFTYQDYQQYAFDKQDPPPKNREFNYTNTEAGFAIAFNEDLSRGTTSPCPTFCSPRLLSNGGEVFEVENMEVWAFTPVDTVNEAQKLEMRKYFVKRNTSGGSTSKSNIRSISTSSADFSSKDFVQGSFFRRVGDK